MTAKTTQHVTLVGPTHPYTGGISQHTTRLALELEARGYRVTIESWKVQYPKRLYPGPVTVPYGEPEIGVASDVTEKLTWYNPASWWASGWRARQTDLLAVSIPTPFHAIPYLVMLAAIGKTIPTLGIVHNVLPHEPGLLDRTLMRVLLGALDRIIVHGTPARDTAMSLGVAGSKILERSLPSPWPISEAPKNKSRAKTGPLRALFFGTVRHYKGLDILLEAVAQTSYTELTIAGEFWEDQAGYLEQMQRLDLANRVTIRSGYVAQADFPELFGGVDVLVLPYRSGTGSIVRELGFRFGLPVIATDVGAIAEGIEDGTNGRIVPAENVEALRDALAEASNQKTLAQWSRSVREATARQSELWENYTQALLEAMAESAKGSAA